MKTRLAQAARVGLISCYLVVSAAASALAAPYAAVVIDARSGEVLHARNADTRLHPASLTKMMTLYVVFQAIKNGEISADTMIKISKKAAAEPPSKLGLKPGQRIALRYLIRAAAVKSANDAATALAEAISGSEAAFARRMNRTAKALGMTRTTFKNAHGLTESGHMSTARDMTLLGRALFYNHPEYYNLFSRRSTHAGVRDVANTNRRFLGAYKGADGIKTGYTRAAGFNLVASAERGNERIIATMFGGRSTAQRNARVAELLDMGFRRAPSRVAVIKPGNPRVGPAASDNAATSVASSGTPGQAPAAGKSIRVIRAVSTSPFPTPRPGTGPAAPSEEMLVAMAATIEQAVSSALPQPDPVTTATLSEEITVQRPVATPVTTTVQPVQKPETLVAANVAPSTPVVATSTPTVTPQPRPVLAAATLTPAPKPVVRTPVVVTRVSTSGGRHWGINVGRFTTRNQAERVLLKTALAELGTLDDALRKVASSARGHDANFVGMTEAGAERACRRLAARSISCTTIGPAG